MQSYQIKPSEIWIERLIIVGLVAVIIVASYLLVRPKSRSITDPIGHTIKLIEKINDVRKKTSSDLSWFPTVIGEYFSQNDMVFTGNESFGKLRFSDGSEIILSPNSILSVQKTDTDSILKIEQGEFSGTLGSNTRIKLQGDRILKSSGTTKTDFKLNLSANKGIQLAVKGGQAELVGPGTQTQKVQTGQAIKQSGEKTLVIEEQLSILTPDRSTLLYKSPSQKVSFKWSYKGKAKSFRLTLSTNNQFLNPLSYESKTTSLNIDVPYNKIYFWKIEAISGDQSLSQEKSYFFGKKISSPKLFSPENESSFNWPQQSKESAHISFRWSATDTKEESEFIISKDPTFQRQFKVYKLKKSLFSVSLKEGIYFWRVRSLVEGNTSDWSETRRFQIKSVNLKDYFKIVSPRSNEKFYIDDGSKTLSIEIKVLLENIKMDDARFIYEVASDANFSKILDNRQSTQLNETFSLQTNNRYYVRIKVESTKFNFSTNSTSFIIEERKSFKTPQIKSQELEFELK